MIPHHCHRFVLLLVACLSLATPPAAMSAAECVAWPGEPEPLPTVDDPDRLRAAWAAARASELARLARVLEGSDRVEAFRFWQHARCLAPSRPEWAGAAERARPSAVHRPVEGPAAVPAGTARDPTDGFDGALRFALRGEGAPSLATGAQRSSPVERRTVPAGEQARAPRLAASASPPAPAVATAPPAAPGPPVPAPALAPALEPAPTPDWLEESLEAVASLIRQARFRSALESVHGIQAQASRLTPSVAVRKRLARVEVLAGTAKVALGQTDSARDHFRRALDADPALELDAATSPKVRRTFDSVRVTP